MGALVFRVLYVCPMATSVDFVLVSSGKYSPVKVMSFNEEAYQFLTEDCPVTPVSGGYVEMSHADAGDFETDAYYAGMTCSYM